MNLIKNIIVILFSIAIPIVVMEWFLYLENRYELPNKYEYKGAVEVYKVIKSGTHSDKSKRNLYVFGDSFVAGDACAAENKDMPSQLNVLLPEYNVINMGMGGKTVINYIDMLDTLPVRENDSVLLVLYDNDIHIEEESCQIATVLAKRYNIYLPKVCSNILDPETGIRPKDEQGLLRIINQEIKDFKIVELIKEALWNVPLLQKYYYRGEYINYWNDFDSEELIFLESSLAAFDAAAREKGLSVSYAYYPNTNRISYEDSRHAIWLGFIEHASRNLDIEIFDPYPYLVRNAPTETMVWSLTDKHPSCKAHRLMAMALADGIPLVKAE